MNTRKTEALVLVAIITLPLTFIVVHPVFAEEPDFLFNMNLVAPSSHPNCVQSAQFIANELPKIGIQCNLLLIGWDALFSGKFNWTFQIGYGNGGFDAALFPSESITLIRSLQFFYPYNFDPIYWALNLYPTYNETLDSLLELIMTTQDFYQRKDYIKQALDLIVWGIHPVTGIGQEENVYFLRDNLAGFESVLFPSPELMSFTDGQSNGHGCVNELIVAGPLKPVGYNPLISNIRHDRLTLRPAFTALVERDTDFGFVPGLAASLPYPVAVTNNYDGLVSSTDPSTAKVWDLELRHDIYWHEGYGYTMTDDRSILNLDADDVVWLYQAIIDDDGFPHPDRSFFQFVFGTDPAKAVEKVGQFKIRFHLANLRADLMTLFGIVLPQHILDPTFDAGYGPGVRKDGTNASNYETWETDDYNKGKRTSGDTIHAATIGNGAYILYPGENAIQQTVTLTNNPYYFKDNDRSYWGPLVADRYDKYIYTWIDNKEAAKTALVNGDIDIIDSEFKIGLFSWLPNEEKINLANEYDYSRTFSYGVNQNHFMTKKGSPYGIPFGVALDKSLAWGFESMWYNIHNGAGGHLTNKWVRLAISHIVPRQTIADNNYPAIFYANSIPFPQQSPYFPDELKATNYNHTRALEYLERAGYDVSPYRIASGFDVLTFFIALGGMIGLIIPNRLRKLLFKEKP